MAQWLAGGTVTDGLARLADLVVLLLAVVQFSWASSPTCSDTWWACTACLTHSSRRAWAPPLACQLGATPLSEETAVLAAVLTVAAAAAAAGGVLARRGAAAAGAPLSGGKPAQAGAWALPAAFGGLLFLLNALYALAANAALGLLRCTNVQLSVGAYLRLNQNGASLAAAGVDLGTVPPGGLPAALAAVIPVSVLAAEPSAVCHEGAHARAFPLAVVVLGVVLLGYPLAGKAAVPRSHGPLLTGAGAAPCSTP